MQCLEPYFTVYWLGNFEIRVGRSSNLGNNELCHKQLDPMDVAQANITCSRDVYGDWVSINKTRTQTTADNMALGEVRVFGSEYWVNKIDNHNQSIKVV